MEPPTPSPKAATAADREVAARLRHLRQAAGMSQTTLGEALGVTFQQVQKYERGINRISASRLRQVAALFGVGLAELMGGDENGSAEPSQNLLDLSPEGARVVRALARIRNARVRRSIVGLIEAVADREAPDGQSTPDGGDGEPVEADPGTTRAVTRPTAPQGTVGLGSVDVPES